MRNKKAESRLAELVAEVREIADDRFSKYIDLSCDICGVDSVQIDTTESESVVEYYEEECLTTECEGTVEICHARVEAGNFIRIRARDVVEASCTADGCEPNDWAQGAIIADSDPIEQVEYDIPVKAVISTTIHQHHTRYEPEETMPVCARCHGKIHHNDEFRPDLRPEMMRKEWIQEADS